MQFTREDYDRLSRPRFGTANPERIDNPLWQHIIRSGDHASRVRMQFDDAKAEVALDRRSRLTASIRAARSGLGSASE